MKKFLQLVFALVMTTGLFAQDTVWSEDFEGGMPAGWFAESGWEFGNSSTLSSAYFTIPAGTGNVYSTNDDAAGAGVDDSGRLVTAAIDLTALDATAVAVLSFDYFFVNGDWEGDNETAKVGVSTDGVVYTEILDLEDRGTVTTGVTDALSRAQVVLEGYAGQSITLAFEYNDGGGWNYGFAIDNAQIDVLTVAKDVRLDAVAGWGFADSAAGLASTLEVSNDGYETINTLDVEISDASGVVGMTTVEGLDIPFGTTGLVELDFDYDISVSQEYSFTYNIINVNGGADEVIENNQGAQTFVSVDTPPTRRWLIEELTSPGCPWCPRGAVFMDTMEEEYPDKFVGVAVHGNFGGRSPMMVDDYANPFFALNGEAYPTMSIERELGGTGIPALENMLPFGEAVDEVYTARTAPGGVAVTALVDDKDRMLNITADVEWRANHSGDYSLLVIVTEDDVTGTTTDYAQTNNYVGGGQGVMGGYELLPNPVPAADMSYDHVLRASPTGYNGDASVFAGTFTVGEMNSATYTYAVPEEYDLQELNVIAVILNNETGAAVNSVINRDVAVLSSTDDYALEGVDLAIKPNPASDVAYVNLNLVDQSDVQLTLRNTLGQVVAQNTYTNISGTNVLPIQRNDLDQGTYFVTVTIDGKSATQRVIFAN